jgi:tetratricopeptide (TPR) repeat protein
MTIGTSSSRRARLLAACGRALQAIGLWRQAGSAFEAALVRDNRVPDWRYRLGLSLEHQGRLAEAATEYEQVLTRGETDLRARAQSAIERITLKALKVDAATAPNIGEIEIVFLPAPSKSKNLASARIRCTYMAAAINQNYAPSVSAVVDGPDSASIIVVSQTCTAKTLVTCALAKARGARIVYDCCDPYADYEGMAHGIYAAQRFRDIVSIADAVTVPTETMRVRIADQGVNVPIIIVPDSIDYQEQLQSDLVPPTKSVVWFGNPGRRNLESGLWALRALRQRWNLAVTLITDPAKVEALSGFSVEPWTYKNFVAQLRRHGLVLVSQDPSASYKSENRYVVSMINGVPTISTGSQSIAKLLSENGFAKMNVGDERELEVAVELLSDADFRKRYVVSMQQIIRERFGSQAVARCFIDDVLRAGLGLDLRATTKIN